jgi:hypothetical protein
MGEPAPSEPAWMAAPPPPITPKKSNRNTIIAIVVVVVLLCCCCPAVIGIAYLIAQNMGVLPASLGGTTWLSLLML